MNYDAILILGGGLRPGGLLPEYAKLRFDLALASESGEPMVPLSAGTTRRPATLDADGRLFTESRAGARYLIDRGIDPRRIYCESTAYDTIGNAYFSRVQLTDPLGWRRPLVITSEFHMPRTEAIFRWIFSLDSPFPYSFEFAASPNAGLTMAELEVRKEKEEASLHMVEQLRDRLTSFRSLAHWLFTEHRAYTPLRDFADADVKDLHASY